MADFFEPVLEDLQAAFPQWLKVRDPDAEAYKILAALADLIEELITAVEAIHADQALASASDSALRTEWAPLYGAGAEQLPFDTEQLRAYLQARAAEDGSLPSLEATLMTILTRPENGTPPPPMPMFPIDGSGLLFPADGSGIAFPDSSWLEITADPGGHTMDITVRDFLIFDRAAFARAVERFRLADDLPSTITETAA